MIVLVGVVGFLGLRAFAVDHRMVVRCIGEEGGVVYR